MAFMFRLEQEDGSPADPPTFKTAVPNWSAGDTIPLGRRTLRVVTVRDDELRSLDGPRTRAGYLRKMRAGPRSNLYLFLTCVPYAAE